MKTLVLGFGSTILRDDGIGVYVARSLGLGRRLQFPMPSEVVIFGVQVGDARTLGEECTDAVARVIPLLADEIIGEISGGEHATISIGLSQRRHGRA